MAKKKNQQADKLLTPQQEAFLAAYTDPKSPTFSNATQSALKAGYSQEYADNITSLLPDWLSESMGDMRRLKKAERNLEKILDMKAGKDNARLKIQQDTSKFIAETVGKNKYSKKTETDVTSGGQPITVAWGTPPKPHESENNNDSV